MDKYLYANMVLSKFSRDYMELKRDLPIRPSEMGVLNIITGRDGAFTPLALAQMIGVSKPMIAAHIQALIKKGYAYKEASPEDKRSFFVRPTKAGLELAQEYRKKESERLSLMEALIGEENFAELVRLIDRIEATIESIKEK